MTEASYQEITFDPPLKVDILKDLPFVPSTDEVYRYVPSMSVPYTSQVQEVLGMNVASRAMFFATGAHEAIGQKRKYTGDPYIIHPQAVAKLVESVPHTPEMIAAAWLHDVVEDTQITIYHIQKHFERTVADMVWDLTDQIPASAGNRATRKRLERERLAKISPEAQTIKLADMIDNTATITTYDPGFAKVYMAEKRELLAVMTEGDPTLYARANALVKAYYKAQP